MIVGIGTDIIEIKRIEEKIKKDSFVNKVFSAKELENIKNKGNKSESYAGVFAAKEAVAKAFGTGFRNNLRIEDICILNDYLGKPYVEFIGENKERYNNLKINISISHCKDYAVAFAIIED